MDKASRGDGFANKATFFDIEVGFVAIGGFLVAIATLFDVVTSLGILG